MRLIAILLVLTTSYSLLISTGSAQELLGQVFISRDDGPAVRLSGVEVRIYDEQVMNDYILARKTQVLPIYSQFQGELDRLTPKGEYVPRAENRDKAQELLAKILAIFDQFWNKLPAPEQSTWTDADGNYRITPSSSNYVVFSQTKKYIPRYSIVDKTNTFIWIISAKEIDTRGPLHLTQHNQYRLIMK
jgi:hypothetical protein